MKQLVPRVISCRPDWVILQYNPFSYGRWGLNLQLPEVMLAIKNQCPEVRIALMVHEPFVPVLDLKHAVMTTWQRWQLFRLGRCANIVTFSIEPWAQKFRSWFPKQPVECLAVGSNIPYIPTDRAAIRGELGISDDTTVLGFFGTAHNSRLLPWVREAAEAIAVSDKKALILYVGPNADVMKEVLTGIPLLATGSLPSSEVSRHFAAMDIHLSPFVDGISSRRGSFLTGLQHGLPTVGTYGYNTSPFLLAHNEQSYLLTDVNSLDKFKTMVRELAVDLEKRERIGLEAQHLFDSEFAWNKIATRLCLMLRNYSQLNTGRI